MKLGYKQTEFGVIPEEWEAGNLDRFWNVTDCKHVTAQFVPNGFPLASIREVQSRFVDLKNAKQTTAYFYNQLIEGGRKPRSGDLILSRNATVGEIAQVADWHPPFAMGQDVCLLQKKTDGQSTDFLQAVFQSHIILDQLANLMVGSTFKRANVLQIRNFSVPIPKPAEQRAIAEALSDMDELQGALDRLITKKRDLKQAAMQQLLTGQTRLPGFHGEWVMKSLGEMAIIGKGTQLHSTAGSEHGTIPHYNGGTEPSNYTDSANTDANTIAISEGGNSCGYVHFITRPFWCGGHCYAVTPTGAEKKFLYHCLKTHQPRIMGLRVGSGLPNVQKAALVAFRFAIPTDPAEQSAIAEVLGKMDEELAALERRRAKTLAIKRAMMQQLLTGQTRLIQPVVSNVIPVDFAVPLAVSTPVTLARKEKKHNWAINEAVVVAVLVKHFGSETFPLGRKRCTKLSYLLHRHVEHVARGYLKKAAGPYNPAVKYRGPEGIAQKNGYIRSHKSGNFSGFVAADKIAQAETYFEKWYSRGTLKWLEQFRRKTNDDLERLTTVDMAMEELRRGTSGVSLESVRGLIAAEPAWAPKLDRVAFSDAHIIAAIEQCRSLFPT